MPSAAIEVLSAQDTVEMEVDRSRSDRTPCFGEPLCTTVAARQLSVKGPFAAQPVDDFLGKNVELQKNLSIINMQHSRLLLLYYSGLVAFHKSTHCFEVSADARSKLIRKRQNISSFSFHAIVMPLA